jgi:hypothetical protein
LALPQLALTFLPYQFLISISAVRAVGRELRRQNNWEKTIHLGAHRLAPKSPITDIGLNLPEAIGA